MTATEVEGLMEYLIDEGVATAQVAEKLRLGVEQGADFPVCLPGDPPDTQECTFFDTFDWVLYQSRMWLRWSGTQLELHGLDGAQLCAQPLTQPPCLLAGLPEGPVRARIARVVGVRRLLPMLVITQQVQELRLIDANDKTRARVLFEQAACHDPAGATRSELHARVQVQALRGYETDAEFLEALLERDPAVHVATQLQVNEALAAVGRRPGDYSSRLDFQLDPAQRSDEVTRQILRFLRQVIEVNLPGVRANWDPEFLHDFRVAVRRTRSALSQIKGVFPSADVERFRSGFAWLQQVTGPVRDLDVYLLEFDAYRDSLPFMLQAPLEPLRDFLHGRYGQARRDLLQALDSPEFAQLMQEWQTFLERPLPPEPLAPAAVLPIRQLADRRIRRMARRVHLEGRAISEDSPPPELHELRKSCKKLRYLIEFFRCLYPAGEIRELIQQLKDLLDQLGDFQDLEVQAHSLEAMARELLESRKADADTLLAMGALIGALLERQQGARGRFAAVFAAFDAPESRAREEALFAAPADGREGQ